MTDRFRWRPIWSVLAIGVVLGWWWTSHVVADTLIQVRDYLPRQQVNIISGLTHQIFITPATSLPGSGNTIVLTFPADQSGEWCRTAGNDLTAAGLTDPDGATENAVALPGPLVAECAQGNGVTTGDTITVSAIEALTAGTKYGVMINDGGATALGTASTVGSVFVIATTTNGTADVDLGTFALTVHANDRVVISALVSTAPEPPIDPIVRFIGLAAPAAAVRVYLNDDLLTPIGSVTANAAAAYDLTLTDQATGQNIYTISATDTVGRDLTATTFALNLTAGSTTVISGVFLGPSIAVANAAVKLGQTVDFTGQTAPGSEVTLTVNGADEFSTTANSAGQWSLAVAATDLGIGTHAAVARARAPDNTLSENSVEVGFTISKSTPPATNTNKSTNGSTNANTNAATNTTTNTTNATTNTPTNQPAPPADQCDGKLSGDLNCDGQIDLIDFSIMFYYWQQRDPSNSRVDLNHDRVVNIIDFSIMLFQCTDYQ